MEGLKGFRPEVNIRDLGGIETQDGRVVKPGLIYRSGGPYLMDEDEVELLRALGLKTIFDLRTTAECERHPDPEVEGAKHVRYSGVEFRGGEEIDFSPAGMHRLGDGARDQYEKMHGYYIEMPFDNEAFRLLMESLEDGCAPLLFHCASGKDRTGVAAMVVLLALGVSREDVFADYLYSNVLLAGDLERAFAEHAADIAEDELAATLTQMESGVSPAIGEAVLDEIFSRYGSVEGYLAAEFGLDGERLERFREKYLEAGKDGAACSSDASSAARDGDCPSVLKQSSAKDACGTAPEGQSRPSARTVRAGEEQAAPFRARILFSSDVHGAVTGRSYADGSAELGGFARIATLVEGLRDENTLLIDGGDTIEGSPLSSFHARKRLDEVFPATLAMQAIGYDFEILGNHDFNFGREVFVRHLESSGAKSLTGNMRMDGEAFAPSYAIVELAGLRVALVGATTSAIPRWELPANLEGIEFADALAHVRSAVAAARKEGAADMVVVAYHGGFERDPETGEAICDDDGENQAYAMLREVEGIDVLLTGHQHRVMCGVAKGADGRGVAYVQPGAKGAYLACVDIDVATRTAEPKLIAVDAEADQRILDLVAEEEAACQTWLDQPLGSSLVDLTVDDDLAAEVEKVQLVTFLNLVQLAATGAELSATAIFPGATGFAGEITMRDLVSTYRFANTLAVKRVTGAQLRAYLERCAEYFALDENGAITRAPAWADPPADFNYDMVDGIDYTIDLTRPAGERVIELARDGRSVEDDDSFTLAVNSYRAAGGGGFPMIAEAPTISENLTDMVELIANYILAQDSIDFEPAHNIRIVKE